MPNIFDKRPSIPRKEMRSIVRKSFGAIPRTSGERFNRVTRDEMARTTFGARRFGKDITKKDFKKAITYMSIDKRKEPDPARKMEIDKKIRFFKKIERIGK